MRIDSARVEESLPWDSQRDVSTALDLKVGPPKGLISLLLHSVRNIGCFTDGVLHFDPSIRNIGCFTDGVLDFRIDSARVEEFLSESLHTDALTALSWQIRQPAAQGRRRRGDFCYVRSQPKSGNHMSVRI